MLIKGGRAPSCLPLRQSMIPGRFTTLFSNIERGLGHPSRPCHRGETRQAPRVLKEVFGARQTLHSISSLRKMWITRRPPERSATYA